MVKTASAVDWYAKEHLKLLVQLENKELTLGEYVVKHQDILQKAKSIEDLTSLKKRNTELQDQVLLNDTTNKLMEKQTAVEWLVKKLEESGIPLMKDELKMIQQAKQMDKQQKEECWNVAHQSGRFEGKGIAEENWQTFEQYYNETFGKQ
jgi:hypothetical protein